MKTAIKIIAVLAVLLIVAVVGLFIFAFSQVDKIAKIAIEEGGTYALQVETSVESVDVNITGGTATMTGLNIANPDGFDTSHFFALADTSASVDLQTVNTDTIVLPQITLNGIDVILDKGNDPSNYNQILENLQRFESDDSGSGEAQSEGGKSLVIDSLKLQDINIRVANMPGVSLAVGDVAINIPEIELRDVGKNESMSTGEVINLVVKTVLAAAVEAGGGIIPGDVLGELGNGLAGLESLSDLGIEAISDLKLDETLGNVSEELGKAADEVMNNAQEQVDEAVEDVQNQVEDAVKDGIKGIFGNEDDGP
jgi:uncharacterized protein YjbJ (UPF0337 family)